MMELNNYFALNASVLLGTIYLFAYPLGSFIKFISSKFQCYKDLSAPKNLEWTNSSKSLIHSIVICILILLSYIFNEDSYKDPIWGQYWLSGVTVAFATGYAIVDLYWTIRTGSFGFIIHHLALIVANCWILVGGFFWQVWMLRGIVELSSIFLHIRSLFIYVGKKDSKMAFYNNLIFSITFFLTRIAPMHLVYFVFYNHWGAEELERTGAGKYCFLTMIPLDILNIYWFCFIARSFYKKVILGA